MATRYQVATMSGLNCLSNTAINKKPIFFLEVVINKKALCQLAMGLMPTFMLSLPH
jgi:hypothetical protein